MTGTRGSAIVHYGDSNDKSDGEEDPSGNISTGLNGVTPKPNGQELNGLKRKERGEEEHSEGQQGLPNVTPKRRLKGTLDWAGESKGFNGEAVKPNHNLVPPSPGSSTKSARQKTSRAAENRLKSPEQHNARVYRALKLKSQTAKLPVNERADYLVQAIMDQDTTIIMAETGSGKSTQIPQLLQKHPLVQQRYRTTVGKTTTARTPSIAITQPRRLPCVSLATRVAEEMGVQLGREVGYAVRFESKESAPKIRSAAVRNRVSDLEGGQAEHEQAGSSRIPLHKERKGETKLRYCTEGVLLREISMGRSVEQSSQRDNTASTAGGSGLSQPNGETRTADSQDVEMNDQAVPSSRPETPTTSSSMITQTQMPSIPPAMDTDLSFYPNLPPSLLLRYDIIIVDEAHERTLNTDFLLGTLKQIQAARKGLTKRLTAARARKEDRDRRAAQRVNGVEPAETGEIARSSEIGTNGSAFASLIAQGDRMDVELANGHAAGTSSPSDHDKVSKSLSRAMYQHDGVDAVSKGSDLSLNELKASADAPGLADEVEARSGQAAEDEEILRADWGGWEMRELKLVIMSATLQADLFSEYFDGAQICQVKGRSYEVAIKHIQEVPTDMDSVEMALKQCLSIHIREEAGDILVFLPGQEDIEKLVSGLKAVEAELSETRQGILAMPLYRLMGQDAQGKVFQPAPHGKRKIIVSTNIAETGVTIDGIKFVVDAGTQKQKMVVIDRNMRLDALITAPCSQSAARQRSGRAGRTTTGICYRLYTEDQYMEKPVMTTPEIANANLASAFLQLISITPRPLEFPFLENPDADAMSDAIRVLFFLHAIEIQASGSLVLTVKGRRMLRYPIAPESAATLIESFELGSTAEVLTILAIREAGSPIADTPATRDEAAEKRKAFASREGDHLTHVKIYQAFDEIWTAFHESGTTAKYEDGRHAESPSAWAKVHGLSLKNLKEAKKIRLQLSALVKAEGENPEQSAGNDSAKVMLAVLRGLARNAAQLDGSGLAYKPYAGGMVVKIHPSSVIHGKKSLAIVYDELRLTSGSYAHCVSTIDPSWLDEISSFTNGRMQPLLNNTGEGDEGLRK